MKKCILLAASFVLFFNCAMAETAGYGISLGYGGASPDIDIHRVGLTKDFSSKWFQTDIGYLSGYFELSYNHWEWNSDEVDGIAFSPVFAYYFGDETKFIRPYIEAGIGMAYIDEYNIAKRDLSTNFQFEDQVGVGAKIGSLDLNFRYMHYSNASIKEPNDGINILIFTTTIQF